MNQKDLELIYGKPDSEVVNLERRKCDHYFIRNNASEVGCANCLNRWIDGGKFVIQDGKIIGIKTLGTNNNQIPLDQLEWSWLKTLTGVTSKTINDMWR